MNTPLPLDAAALDRWSALLARIIDHSDGTRPFAEVYDDELEPFIAQSRAAMTLAARVAELEKRERRFYAADGSFVEMESAEAVVAARIEAAKRVAELEANNEGSLKAAAYWKGLYKRFRDDAFAATAHANALRDDNEHFRKQAWERVLEANALRDALESVRRKLALHRGGDDSECECVVCSCDDLCAAALAATPAASLAAYRKSVLEEAAALADKASHESGAQGYSGGPKYVDMTNLAARIRALAAQAATHSVPGGTSEVKP